MEKRKKNPAKNLQLDLFDDLLKKASDGDSIAMMKALAYSGRGYDMSDEEIEEICKLNKMSSTP